MKIRIYAALLIAVLTLSMLSGCAVELAEETLDAAADAVEDSLERAVRPAASTDKRAPSPEERSVIGAAETKIGAEEAKALALAHAGLLAEDVRFIRSEYELDDRIPHYDIEFHHGYWEYEYEIHAETGKLLSAEKDT